MEVLKKMDTNELRSLQEAYLEVVNSQQVDEARKLRPASERMARTMTPRDRAKQKRERELRDSGQQALADIRALAKGKSYRTTPSSTQSTPDSVVRKLPKGQKVDKLARAAKKAMGEEVEVDEAMSSYDRNRQRAAQRAAARNAARAAGKTGVVPGVGYVSPRRERETYTDEKGTVRHKSGAKMEQVSVYDIVLSHLLDEGYADTVESAEGIMVNMSEEWRDSIVEVLDTPERANAYARKNVRSMLGAFAKGVANKDISQLKTINKRTEGAKRAKRKAERKAAEEES